MSRDASFASPLQEIELFCFENLWTESRFGREFAKDPNFVFELRAGRRKDGSPRRLRSATKRKLVEFIQTQRELIAIELKKAA